MIHVYLDDWRPYPPGFAWAKDAEECILMLQECEVDILSLDHDLGYGVDQTGMDVVHWIVQHRKFPRRIYIHTSSTSAGSRMYQMLYASKPEHVRVYPSAMPDEVLVEVSLKAKSG